MSKFIKYLAFFLGSTTANYLPAQTLNPQYNFKQLNVQNGLAQNIVYHFLQDSRGYVWLGTRNGLTMYDGLSTVNFLHSEQKNNSLASNFITRILEDTAHRLWIGNEKGIDLFNRGDNTFTHYGVDRPGGEKDNTYCGPLAFVSPTELWFIDPKTKSIRAFDTKKKSTRFICGMGEIDGTIYISPQTHIIHFWSYQSNGTIHLSFKGHKLLQKQTFFTGTNDAFRHTPLEVIHALPQNDTTTWLCTNEGLVCLNAVANTFKIYNNWKGEPVKELRFAALSTRGVLWIGSGASGVYTFDINNRVFINNYRNNRADPFSVCSNNIVAVYLDRSGNVWCGSYGNGSSYADVENDFFSKHVCGTPGSANNILWAGLDENENCWCIIDDQNGFWVFDKTFTTSKHVVPVQEDGSFFNGSVYKLVFDGQNIWLATNKGLYLYKRQTNKMHQVKYSLLSGALFGSSWLKDMFKLRDGSIIFSTFAGLYQIKKEGDKPLVSLFSRLNEIDDKSFDLLYEDETGNIFVKGDDSLFVLTRIAGKEPTVVKSFAFPFDTYQYFSDTVQGVVYIATNGGLYVLNKNNFNLRKETVSEQMPFESVSEIFEKDKKLWLFGEKGLYYFDQQTGQGRIFTVEDGLPGNEFNPSAFAFSKEGRCIAGSINGLVSFYPGKLQTDLYPPHAQVEHIYVNDSLYKKIVNADEAKTITLTHRQNTFAFDFAAIAFQHNNDCSYEYKLDGYDAGWIKSGNTRYTRYSKIPPGTYYFQLRVYDVNGVASPFTKTIEIKISKAFWQTDLFRFFIVGIILFIAWLAVKWYLAGKIRKQKVIFEKQQAIEQERTRIAMEMHDDLGSGLTSIRYLAGTLSAHATSEIQNKADKIASSARKLVDSMNDIIWTMKSDNNMADDILAYIRKQAAEQLEMANINFSFDFPENIPEIRFSSEQKRNLLLISKEAIHNIIKHSNATGVVITAQITEHFLQLKITDNGKGFDPANQTQFGNGLKNMHKRAKEMNAQLTIQHAAGTTINVTLPFG